MRYGNDARQYNHDQTQSYRRTKRQNEELVDLINSIKPVEGQVWAIGDVPPEGGVLEVFHPASQKTWLIERDGTVEEKETK